MVRSRGIVNRAKTMKAQLESRAKKIHWVLVIRRLWVTFKRAISTKVGANYALDSVAYFRRVGNRKSRLLSKNI